MQLVFLNADDTDNADLHGFFILLINKFLLIIICVNPRYPCHPRSSNVFSTTFLQIYEKTFLLVNR